MSDQPKQPTEWGSLDLIATSLDLIATSLDLIATSLDLIAKPHTVPQRTGQCPVFGEKIGDRDRSPGRWSGTERDRALSRQNIWGTGD